MKSIVLLTSAAIAAGTLPNGKPDQPQAERPAVAAVAPGDMEVRLFDRLRARRPAFQFVAQPQETPVAAPAVPQPMPKGPAGPPVVAPVAPYARGYVPPTPDVRAARHTRAAAAHGLRLASLPKVTAVSFDCRTMGWTPAVKDQGDCGSCYQFSGAMTCTSAFYKAGYKSQIGTGFAEQYGMDCHNWGGCNGGDEYDVIAWAKANGLPTDADYGPYTARSSTCKLKPSTKLWKIADFGYCTADQSDRFPTYQELKNAIAAYGPISVAGSANGWDSYTGGLFKDHGGRVDHAYMMIGWDDTKSPKGAILLQNQWSTSWGEQGGFCWAEYGANQIGTEAIWTTAAPLPPPPDPPPPPPPPPPPKPTGDIVIRVPAGTAPGTYVVGESALSDADKAILQAAQDVIARLTGGGPAPVGRVPIIAPEKWVKDTQVAGTLAKAAKQQGAEADYKKITASTEAHPLMMRLAEPPQGEPAAELPTSVITDLLDWFIKNGPALLALIAQIIAMFGL